MTVAEVIECVYIAVAVLIAVLWCGIIVTTTTVFTQQSRLAVNGWTKKKIVPLQRKNNTLRRTLSK